MSVKRSEMPKSPAAAAIVKCLSKITATGRRPADVFDDWLELTEATLDMLPAHARSAAQTGRPAEDSPEVAEIWSRVRSHYGEAASRGWVFERFAEAFGLLLQNAHEPDGRPTYQDIVGEIYMAWGWPSSGLGQYFTPWPVAQMMAQMMSGAEKDIHEHLKAAIEKSPVAQALAFAGIVLEGDEAFKWFVTRLVPACIEHYEPVKVCDPCVGSGIMLLAHASTMPAWMVQMGLVQYYGMDIDRTCVQMARINCKLYGMNGWGLKCALELSEVELNSLPEPYRTAYAEAQAAQANGNPERVTEIATELRAGAFSQLSLFCEEPPSILDNGNGSKPHRPKRRSQRQQVESLTLPFEDERTHGRHA